MTGTDKPEPAATRDAWQAAEDYGIDMSLIEDRLAMTPEQRIDAHQSALNLALELREAMKGKSREMNSLSTVLQRLVQEEVEFVVVGGFAAMAHGSAMTTQDVDVCCGFSEENLQRLQAALVDLHPVHRMTPNRLPLDTQPGALKDFRNLYLTTDLGQLDCLSEIKGVGDFQAVRENAVTVELSFGPILVLSLDALIRAKEAMDLPRDRQILMQLKAIQAERNKSDS